MILTLAGKIGRQSTVAFRGLLFGGNTVKRIIINYSTSCTARTIHGTRQHKSPRNKCIYESETLAVNHMCSVISTENFDTDAVPKELEICALLNKSRMVVWLNAGDEV